MRKPLPEKLCPICQRPFSWRKCWERCWDSVVYCSDACRRGTPRGRAAGDQAATIPRAVDAFVTAPAAARAKRPRR